MEASSASPISRIGSFRQKPIRRGILWAFCVCHQIMPGPVGCLLRAITRIPGAPSKFGALLDFVGERPPRDCVKLEQAPIDSAAARRVTHAAREVTIEPHTIFGTHSLSHSSRRRLQANYIALVRDCQLHMPSSAIIAGGRILRQSADTDLTRHVEQQSQFFPKAGQNRYFLARNPRLQVSASYERGILIANRFARNYFHFLIECLPRVIYADENNIESAPFVVSNIPKQCRDLLALFGSFFVLEDGTLTSFKRLHLPYLANFSPDSPVLVPRAAYDTSYLTKARDAILDRIVLPPSGGSKILYLARKARSPRVVFNEDEIIPILRDGGAQILDPGEMSIADQIAAFRSAEIVIAPAGAAVANVLFCHQGARLIVLHQDRLVNPGYFGLLARAAGVSYCSVAGRAIENAVHSSYVIAPALLRRAIDFTGR
jgi:capsular polysaccharide biosynthesis protein